MNRAEDLITDAPVADDGLALFGSLVVAVRFLRRGPRPTLTVWSAIEEAVRWQANRDIDLAATDPLAVALGHLLAVDTDSSDGLMHALTRWLDAHAARFNDGAPWIDGAAAV